MLRSTECIVIGAGQAGLAMSYCLGRQGVEHVVLERGSVGERWKTERWPGLRLLTPNWMMRLPGSAPAKVDPAGFMSAQGFADVLEDYRRRIDAPVVSDCEVLSVCPASGRFVVETTQGDWLARSVIVATGACDQPSVPSWASSLPERIQQVVPSRYRGSKNLPKGNALVVGASATGIQLAAEIAASGRQVTLAAGRHVRSPRRYRGRDLFEWLDASGFLNEGPPVGAASLRLRRQPSMQLVGSDTGRELSLDRLARDGVRIAGRAIGHAGGRISFAANLDAELAAAERRRHVLLSVIDAHIQALGIDAAEDPAAWELPVHPGPGPETLDLVGEDISTVIWATGFRRSYPWLNLPVLDADGEIVTDGGLTDVPGLFVLGLPYMRRRSSAFIDGVGRDAEELAPLVAGHLAHPQRQAA